MQIKAIHQFHPSCANGDGVSNGMIFTRRLLRELGFESEIYCDHIPSDMAHITKSRHELRLESDCLLLVHHSLGYENCAWLDAVKSPKILVYHNITPEHLLPEGGDLRRLSILGRKQLNLWAPGYIGAIGDSENNSVELREAGFENVVCLPLLVDLDRVRKTQWDATITAPLGNAINLLFVGRICENKRQLDLIEVLREFLHFTDQPVRLILAGGISSGDYQLRLESRIRELQLQDHVLLTGKIPDASLLALYRLVDAFVCMSEHEGFGMPLIEAMLFDVPVIAHATSSIPDTLGTGGVMFDDPDPSQVAALIHMVLNEPGMRRRIVAAQRGNLQRFAPARLRQELASYLARLGVEVKVPKSGFVGGKEETQQYWQIEGPFDSNYSLAIVNRQLARALDKLHKRVGLRSMEGTGDFIPSQAFLNANPDYVTLLQRNVDASHNPDVALRFCYPPSVENMQGIIRGFHSYGWEETGFPMEYVSAFNRKLDVITVLSAFVEKVLRDNGVRIPITTTGGGVDHLLNVSPQAPVIRMRRFRFLHVSSCFPRKGVDALLKAYGKAFRASDDVSLIIKTFPNPHNDIEQQLNTLRHQDPNYPHVVVINRDCGLEELVGLYHACDVFVAPSRGEGLGLPMAEAMLFDLPVITTAWGGQRDFCDASTAWLCDYQFAKAQTHLGTAHSVWADPDVEHLSSLMMEVYRLPIEQRKLRTNAAKERVLRDFTWERVAQRVEQTVQSLTESPIFRNEPTIGWISTWNTRCGIATYSSFLSTAIPNDRLKILSNRTSERTAVDTGNVVRCWNMHHEETLDDLFETVVAQRIGAVVIQYNFGFFSLTALGRLIERLQAAGVGVHVFFHATGDLVRDGQKISIQDIASSLAQADRLYVHGLQDLNRFKKFGLVDNVVFFPHGVLPPLPELSGEERHIRGVMGKKVIASYGFLLPHKGIQPLICAFAQLLDRDKSLHLLLLNALYPVAESMHEQKACESLINELGIGDSVTFITDFLPDAECLARLQSADLIVYPYQQTNESSSAAVRMGLAAGRPVAVTPLSIFDDVADAVHILPGVNVEGLTRGIHALLTDSSLVEQQTIKSRQWVAERQWPLLSVRLLNLIDGLANPVLLKS